ncbi:MAG TPA: hypothetical protein VEF55_08745 [Candidatus Binatia bacterium]|nr:hypothetical protein [Candidatus Binatia bacterium]
MSKNYVPEDVLRAHSYAIEMLAAFLVVTGTLRAEQMTDLIQTMLGHMEKNGHKKAAEYARAMWANGLNGEWERAYRQAQQKN